MPIPTRPWNWAGLGEEEWSSSQLQFAADFRVAISASFCSSLSSRLRWFPDMVSVREEHSVGDDERP
jgi:hypothetical protein